MAGKGSRKKVFTLRRFKNWVLSILGLIIIFMAIGFTLIRFAIKSIPDYTTNIQSEISKQLDIKAEVGFIDAEIYWLVPRLNLYNVNIFDNSGKHHLFHFEEIALSLDWTQSIQSMFPVVGEVTLVGMDMQIEISDKGELLVQNYVVKENINDILQATDTQSTSKTSASVINDEIKDLLNNLNFKIVDSRIRIFDNQFTQRSKTLSQFNLKLINRDNEHVFEIEALVPENYGKKIHFIVSAEGDLFDYKNLKGEAYLLMSQFNAAAWLDDYWAELEIAANGTLDLQLWVNWDKQRLSNVQGQVDMADIAMHYLDSSLNTWELSQLNADLWWENTENGWQLDLRNLQAERQGKSWDRYSAVSLVMNEKNNELRLLSNFLRIEGHANLARMASSFIDEEVSWLSFIEKYKPSADFENIDITVPLNDLENIKLNMRYRDLGFSLPQGEPSEVSNFQGEIGFYDNKTWLSFDTKDAQVKFSKLFRNPLDLKKVKGVLSFEKDQNIWHASTDSLVLNTPHIKTESRVSVVIENADNIFVDMTSHFKDGDAKFISTYLPAGVMGPNTLEWLDKGVPQGKIKRGGFQFYGDLSDAPFRKNNGISLVDFDVSGASVIYLDDWPMISDIDGKVRLVNDSLHVVANKGTILNSQIEETYVYIDNFESPNLDIKGKMSTKLADIKTFVLQSDLKDKVSSYIENLSFSGNGDLNLELFLPLYGDYHTEWGGELDILSGGLLFQNEGYELSDLKGEVRFANDIVEAPNLTGKMGLEPIQIKISTDEINTRPIYEFNVNGAIPAKTLLTPLPDLQHYFEGSADWDIALKVFTGNESKGSRVWAGVRSDLVGVSSTAPMPFYKKSDDKLPLWLNINLNPDIKTEYEITLDQEDTISLIDSEDKWQFEFDSAYLKGQLEKRFDENIDAPAKIRLKYLNLDKLFPNENKQDDEQKISSEPSAPDISPRNIDSLDFIADEVIWKNLLLRDVSLRTQKNKLGMAISALSLSNDNFSLQAKGDWYIGRNSEHSTNLQADISVRNLGNIFRKMELTNRLEKARGKVSLNWQWNDMPNRFAWEKLDGDGEVYLKDGTIQEIEAGAGRLIGLLNFRTLLSLDFGNQVSDGFNFDNLSGTFSLSKGNAYSDDFTIESKVADIFVTGRLGLADETVEQKVRVRPQLGSTVTLTSAVVAGPAIGGMVYLFQKIFNTDSLAEYQYTITGSITEPTVELLSTPEEEDEPDYDIEGDF